ncbi:TauD/TfdA family dioxygenase [Streptomyces cyaneofuscatus]|uniref:TauD/TfdA family dioxygenase n=1 Tax=Streptomyces cyaneofuscatus TaxID=66883 RepID=UPI0033A376A5
MTGETSPLARPDFPILKADFTEDRAVRVVPVDASVESVRAPLRDQLASFGFVVASFPPGTKPEAAIGALARNLGLGELYVPVLYRFPEAKGFGGTLSNIEHDDAADHPGFATRSGQPWHVDGTLESIGAIRTSVLYCVRAAVSGGCTHLFNAVAAFRELQRSDPEAAQVLLDPFVLRRISTILSQAEWTDGPAFAECSDGSCVNRFSEGDTVRWSAPEGKEEELERALTFLRARAESGRYRVSVRLEAGQCLIFRNDQISHSREEYVDNPEVPRKLIRALFEQAPE